jgi:hypothetical protein
MAHETLKSLITNNIKTNGQNAITAQILQDVLIAMVDDYPDLSGYATRTWVQQQDYAPKEWVENKHYATQDWANLKFENYLPLEGGTMAGPITYGNNTEGKYEFFSQGLIFSIGAARYAEGVSIGLDEGLPYIHFFWRGGQLIGTEITRTNVTSDAFIKREGTAAQFLKADGSVDENTYATTTQLNNYLPLTGGTLRGYLFFADENEQVVRGEIFGDEFGLNIQVAGYGKLFIENAIEADNTIKTEGFIKRGGTADQVLCADGSVKTLSELKAALNAI